MVIPHHHYSSGKKEISSPQVLLEEKSSPRSPTTPRRWPTTRFTRTRCWLRTFCKQRLSKELNNLIDRAVTALYPRVDLIHSRKVHVARCHTANGSPPRSSQLPHTQTKSPPSPFSQGGQTAKKPHLARSA